MVASGQKKFVVLIFHSKRLRAVANDMDSVVSEPQGKSFCLGLRQRIKSESECSARGLDFVAHSVAPYG